MTGWMYTLEFSARDEGNAVQCGYCQLDVVPVSTPPEFGAAEKGNTV